MQGKHVVITGPTAGIGRACAMSLAALGAELTLLCRNPDKARDLCQDIVAAGGSQPTVILMDMAILSDVRRAAKDVLALGRPIDVLHNNAGVVNLKREETIDGFEETLAVNHYAVFLLTGLLLPALRQATDARIVNVASHAHTFVRDMGFNDMQAREKYRTFHEYGRSKLANILFTRELARRLEPDRITVNSLHPGAVSTSLGQQNGGLLGKLLPLVLKPFFRSPEKGAETSIYLCSSPDIAGVTGEYFYNCKPHATKPWAQDDEAGDKLWSLTEEATQFTYPS
jgi:retinol dehydrogenase 12